MEKELLEIAESVLPIILKKANEDEKKRIKKAYYGYLMENVAASIECAKRDGEEMVRAFVEMKIEDEIEKWKSHDKDTIFEELSLNVEYERLLTLSYMWFERARKIALSKSFLKDGEKEKNIEEVLSAAESVQGIKQEKVAKELSETVCDIEFCYGNERMRSLRLSSIF